ncbi:MAG: membrane-anchored protein YejM (alkaline phosphatase superfamily) [Planctomycetota bacterium]|jgi:membrane-anchored protein YejM (alkaline phosphatase superfamily)
MTKNIRPRRREASRSDLVHAGFQLWLLNLIVGTLVGTLWLFRSLEDASPGSRFYQSLELVADIAIIGLLPAIVMVLAHCCIRRPIWVGIWQSLAGGLFLGLLYADTVVYRLLGYHFNWAIFNVAMTEGSGDAVHLGPTVWITGIAMISGLSVLGYFFWRWRLGCIMEREVQGGGQVWFLKPRVVCFALLLPLIAVAKSMYAIASITSDRELLVASKALPGPKVRLGPLIDSWRGGRKDIYGLLATVSLGGEKGQELTYPTSLPEFPEGAPRPNILLVILDSWRRDAMSAELTPNLVRREAQSRSFANHKSGGNGTRFGLFTMLYGLHGSYWFRALENNTTPVLIDSLQALDYDIRVISAASMNFPEFLQTAWHGLEREQVIDNFLKDDGEPISRRSDVKDGLVADAFVQWMEERDTQSEQRPYFSFVLLDSPHQPYFNPGGPFEPALENELEYVRLGRTTEEPELGILREKVINTYKNSVLYTDSVAEKILARAEQVDRDHPNAAGTIVVVTGDHGEEFYESGFWGHTSNYTPEQVDVPLFMYGPGVGIGVEDSPTSHLDVSNSLMELLGADPELRMGYTQGESLFSPLKERVRVVAGFADVGLLTEQGIIHLPAKAGNEEIWVFDDHWQPMPGMDAIITQQKNALNRLIRDCQQFMRQAL